MRSNPSFHPTRYSGLRPLPRAGELKRSATLMKRLGRMYFEMEPRGSHRLARRGAATSEGGALRHLCSRAARKVVMPKRYGLPINRVSLAEAVLCLGLQATRVRRTP